MAFLIALNGEPKAEIAVTEGCHSAEAFAANDLARWVEAISGAKLPAVTYSVPGKDERQETRGTIFVGTAFAKGVFDDDLAAIGGKDGYAIREKDGNLYLFGTKPRASVYATSALLEDNTDIIWARPAEEFGAVYTQQATLDFKMTDKLDLPAFDYHGWNVCGVRNDWPTAKWAIRNGANLAVQAEGSQHAGELGFRLQTGGHIYWWMAHPDTYFATHPEYYGYSSVAGARVPNTLCLTAPGLVELAVANVAERIEAAGGQALEELIIGARDSWECCQCPNCTAPIPLKDGSVLPCGSLDPQKDSKYYSTRFWLFAGEVARRLHVLYPNLRITGSGYFYAAEPPACEIPSFMHVEFCPVGGVDGTAPLLSEGQSALWRRRTQEWGALVSNRLSFLEYWFAEQSGYAQIAGLSGIWRKSAQDLRDLKNVIGGKGVDSFLTPDSEREYSGHAMRSEWDAGIVGRWVLARLMWNPEQDLDALLDRFYRRAYREAATEMAEFYRRMHNATYDESLSAKKRVIFNSPDAKACAAILQQALDKVRHPTSRILIQRLVDQWNFVSEKTGKMIVPTIQDDEPVREPGNVAWESALELPAFKLPPYFTWSDYRDPRSPTEIRLLTDGVRLFIRIVCTAPRKEGDWIQVKIAAAKDSGGQTFNEVVTPDSPGVRKTDDGYAAIIEIPLAGLKVTFDKITTYPQYFFLRHDAASGEESTVGGSWPGLMTGAVNF